MPENDYEEVEVQSPKTKEKESPISKGKNRIKKVTAVLVTAAVLALSGDQLVTKGALRTMAVNFIMDPAYRDRAITKILEGKFLEEFKQGVSEHQVIQNGVGKDAKLETTEYEKKPWFGFFSEPEVMKYGGRTIFMGNVNNLDLKQIPISENNRPNFRRIFYDKPVIVLPMAQLRQGDLNGVAVLLPNHYTVLKGTTDTVEFPDKDGTDNPRDASLVILPNGNVTVVPSDRAKEYYVSGSKLRPSGLIEARAIATFALSIDIGPGQDIDAQFDSIDHNKSVTSKTELTKVPRFKAFYYYIVGSNKVGVLSVYELPNQAEQWGSDNFLTVRDAVKILTTKFENQSITLLLPDAQVGDTIFTNADTAINFKGSIASNAQMVVFTGN